MQVGNERIPSPPRSSRGRRKDGERFGRCTKGGEGQLAQSEDTACLVAARIPGEELGWSCHIGTGKRHRAEGIAGRAGGKGGGARVQHHLHGGGAQARPGLSRQGTRGHAEKGRPRGSCKGLAAEPADVAERHHRAPWHRQRGCSDRCSGPLLPRGGPDGAEGSVESGLGRADINEPPRQDRDRPPQQGRHARHPDEHQGHA
mmetsp:Transcript_63241/g.135881  ORF Transcript_63241/g.135881 Transcript_63241/m.135881 type:complete len:202 (+) Transcript_63241:331-936(+)